MNKDILIKLNKAISLIANKNRNDQEKFREMLFFALASKTDEISMSLDYLMSFVKQMINGAEIETLLNTYADSEGYKEENIILLVNEVESILAGS
jgi:hypothetical protein